MIWTIAYNGTEQTLADWGLTQVTRKLVSQGIDELAFKADGTLCDATPLFPFKAKLTLWRNRTANGDGTFSGGASWFSGIVTQIPRAGSPDAESMKYKVSGPWWYLDNLVFAQPYLNVFLGFESDGTPNFSSIGITSTHLFLNQGATVGLTKINSGAQMIAALQFALQPFITAGSPPPFQIGTVTPDVDVPIDEVRDITCAEVVRKMLRWSPDAVTWFDYTTQPTTFNCKRRSEMTAADLDISGATALVKSLAINARYDLQAPSVQIFYETQSSVNGTPSLSLNKDFYPNPLPTDPDDQFHVLEFTVDLQGTESNVQVAKITVDAINPTDPNWWLGKHPQYKPWDSSNPADVNNQIASFAIDATTITRTPNPPTDSGGNAVVDAGYINELTTGQLTDWMTFKAQRLTIKCKADITYRNGTVPTSIPLTFQCLSTTAVSGTYSSRTVARAAEPIPVGLAENIFNAINPLQFEGELVFQEEDCGGSLLIGQTFNLTGGANAEWVTMNAMVQEIEEDLDAGTTAVHFGPPKHLSAGELVDLLRVNRLRFISGSYAMRSQGSAASADGGQVDLGQNTPEKNSVSGTTPANPHVISGTVDGKGATVNHSSSISDCVSVWKSAVASPGSAQQNGSVTIRLSDAQGEDLFIQPVNLCLNGVPGKMYFLCSNFIPN